MDPTALLALLPAQYAAIAFAIIGLCAALSAAVPAPKNPKLAAAWRVVQMLGANFGHARNADPVPPVTVPAGPPKAALVLALVLAASSLAACTPAQQQRVTADVQHVCQVQTVAGPAFVVATAIAVPGAASGAAVVAQDVSAVCAAMGGVPVIP